MSEFSAEDYVSSVRVAADFIATRIENRIGPNFFKPEIALTLGSGLGDLALQINRLLTIPYNSIPGFPRLTVEGHAGAMVMGTLGGVQMIALSGRKHFYEVAQEPYGMMQVVFPVHVMANVGVRTYFATNAVGGLNPAFAVGDLMVIQSHIDLFMPDPLTGPHIDFGANPYFQPQHTEYDTGLRELFFRAVRAVGEESHVHEGVYVARTGRTYESAATSRALRALGADAVGMSVIPEVIVATNRAMKTIAVSLVTNKIAADGTNPTDHAEVTAAGNEAKTKKRLASILPCFFGLYREWRRSEELRAKFGF